MRRNIRSENDNNGRTDNNKYSDYSGQVVILTTLLTIIFIRDDIFIKNTFRIKTLSKVKLV